MANIEKTLCDLIKKTRDGAETVKDIVKLKKAVYDAETELNEIYRDLGYEVYLQIKKDGIQPEEIDDLVTAIDAKQAALKLLSDELYAVQGNTLCENCGKLASVKFDFCPWCGSKLFNEIPDDEDEEEDAEPEIEVEIVEEPQEAPADEEPEALCDEQTCDEESCREQDEEKTEEN